MAGAAERVGRDPTELRLIAVGKTHPAAYVKGAVEAGVTDLGENRVQEAAAKKADVPGATWHLIGRLQRNKARVALATFDVIQTVDRPTLVARLAALLEEEWPGRRLQVLVEVNVGGESQKTGVLPAGAENLVREVLGQPCLELAGLMTVPPFLADPEAVRPYFRRLRVLRDELSQRLGAPMPQLSMGMSHDFEVAIEEGATWVRVGTAIFGPREGR